MPQILKTLDEYVVEDRKRETYFIVFNRAYNDIYAFKKEPESDNLEDVFTGFLDKKFVDYKARDEFMNFMKENFPNTKLVEVFDLVSAGYIMYPYLGTVAIDCEENDEVYNAICKKYEDLKGMALSNNAVFWVISYEIALKSYKERKEAWEKGVGMRVFDYSKLKERTWDNEILAYVAQIHEYKGKQDLYLRQKPVELNRLIEIAKIQSTESSNQIEGIVTTNARLKQLVEDKRKGR